MSKKTSIGLQNKGGVRNDSNREQDRVTERKIKAGTGEKSIMGERKGEGQRNRGGMRGARSRTESKKGKRNGRRTNGRRDKDGQEAGQRGGRRKE